MATQKTISMTEYEALRHEYNKLGKKLETLNKKYELLKGKHKVLQQYADAMQDALSNINMHVENMRPGITSSGVKFAKEITATEIKKLVELHGFKNKRNLKVQ